MARYGNILTVFNCTPAKAVQVQNAVTSTGAICTQRENTFYIESYSMANTQVIIDLIRVLNLEFIFFHHHNSDGSQVIPEKIDPVFVNDVKKILLF
jgi:hypothetical protein